MQNDFIHIERRGTLRRLRTTISSSAMLLHGGEGG